MSHTLEALLTQAIDNYPVTATISPEIVAVLFYALSQIEDPDSWLDLREDPLDEITDSDRDEIDALIAGANVAIITPEVGFIRPYITTNPPDNTIPCDGGTYNREDFPLLYAVIDVVFIVDSDHFVTPDLRGLTLIGAGTVGARDFALGDTGDEYEHTLNETEMPPHSHTDIGHVHTYQPPGGTILAVAPGEAPVALPNFIPSVTGSASANLTDTGGGDAHNNIQPYGVVKYCVVAR